MFISKDRAYHSSFTIVTVRMDDFDVRTNSLKITHSGDVSRPQDGCNVMGYEKTSLERDFLACSLHSLEFAFGERGLSRSESDCDSDLLPPKVSWICCRSERSELAGASGALRSELG